VILSSYLSGLGRVKHNQNQVLDSNRVVAKQLQEWGERERGRGRSSRSETTKDTEHDSALRERQYRPTAPRPPPPQQHPLASAPAHEPTAVHAQYLIASPADKAYSLYFARPRGTPSCVTWILNLRSNTRGSGCRGVRGGVLASKKHSPKFCMEDKTPYTCTARAHAHTYIHTYIDTYDTATAYMYAYYISQTCILGAYIRHKYILQNTLPWRPTTTKSRPAF
jgi:hypothetical protein